MEQTSKEYFLKVKNVYKSIIENGIEKIEGNQLDIDKMNSNKQYLMSHFIRYFSASLSYDENIPDKSEIFYLKISEYLNELNFEDITGIATKGRAPKKIFYNHFFLDRTIDLLNFISIGSIMNYSKSLQMIRCYLKTAEVKGRLFHFILNNGYEEIDEGTKFLNFIDVRYSDLKMSLSKEEDSITQYLMVYMEQKWIKNLNMTTCI